MAAHSFLLTPQRADAVCPGGKGYPGTRRRIGLQVVSRFDREAACWGIGTYR